MNNSNLKDTSEREISLHIIQLPELPGTGCGPSYPDIFLEWTDIFYNCPSLGRTFFSPVNHKKDGSFPVPKDINQNFNLEKPSVANLLSRLQQTKKVFSYE